MLKPEQQAIAYDDGYFYPGPAVKDVPVTLAPKESQEVLKEFGRPDYDKLIAQYPVVAPLFGKDLIAAFHKWDEEIGGAKIKR
jgi:putative spermidine/putrescine transport system substrate-binding protein